MKKNKTSVQDTQSHTNKGGYGVLSLMAMIVGIVIGSGIFAKNAGLIGSAGSVPMVALAWLIGALVVVTFVIAFIEIISITEITGEQSTIANWGRHLLGIRFGKFIGYYITLVYFPIIIAALFQFASDSFIHSISYAIPTELGGDSWYRDLQSNPSAYMATIVAVSFVFLLIIMGINAISLRPGKIFQNVGTMIKTIPLFGMIIIFVVMLSKGDGIHFATVGELEAVGINPSGKPFVLLMATLPAVLFAFDGFLLAGAMSKEAKSPNGFRTAFVLSMIFITIIYLLYSLAILGLGVPVDMENILPEDNHGQYGSISNAVYNVFDNEKTAAAVDITVTSIITISMLTGVSGCSIASYRSLSDLSVHNAVRDTEGAFLVKNNKGVAPNAGLAIIGVTSFWFFTMVAFDTFLSAKYGVSLAIADFGSSIIIVLAYFIYSLIIFGGIINRFTHKSPSNKNVLFIPASIVAIILTTTITVMFGWQILNPAVLSDPLAAEADKAVYYCKLGFTGIFFGMIAFFWIGNELTTAKIASEIKEAKNEKAAAYYGLTVEEFEAEKEEVNRRIEEERSLRKGHGKSSSKEGSISDKEAKRQAKEEEAYQKAIAKKEQADKKAKSKKTEKEVKNLNKDDDYGTKKAAPRSKPKE